MSTIEKKVGHLLTLMEMLCEGVVLYPQDEALQERLEINDRTLRRYLGELYTRYGQWIVIEKVGLGSRSANGYRLVDEERDRRALIRRFAQKGDDLLWLLRMAHESDPTLLFETPQERRRELERLLKRDEEIFWFVSPPFEELGDERFKRHFEKARSAIRLRECRDIRYRYEHLEELREVKCLKIVFANHNWYLAIETQEGQFRLLRFVFIEAIEYGGGRSYPKSALSRYAPRFEALQNAMSIDAPQMRAVLEASPRVALYFTPGMKPFFPSQRFIAKTPDGGVRFELAFTQPMEILPFIKQWLPDLNIIEPHSLREALKADLHAALNDMI